MAEIRPVICKKWFEIYLKMNKIKINLKGKNQPIKVEIDHIGQNKRIKVKIDH